MAESQNTTSPAEGAITLTTIAALQAAYERSEAAQLRIDRENCCKNVPHDKLLGDLASSELCAQSEVLEQAILREAPVHLVDVLTVMLHVNSVADCIDSWDKAPEKYTSALLVASQNISAFLASHLNIEGGDETSLQRSISHVTERFESRRGEA